MLCYAMMLCLPPQLYDYCFISTVSALSLYHHRTITLKKRHYHKDPTELVRFREASNKVRNALSRYETVSHIMVGYSMFGALLQVHLVDPCQLCGLSCFV